MERTYKVIAVDFDKTLCDSIYPGVGEPIKEVVKAIKLFKGRGDKIILWTCREGEDLDVALEWCEEQGLSFDAVNDNLPELKELFGNNPRKIAADIYIDDKALSTYSVEKIARQCGI